MGAAGQVKLMEGTAFGSPKERTEGEQRARARARLDRQRFIAEVKGREKETSWVGRDREEAEDEAGGTMARRGKFLASQGATSSPTRR